MNKILSDLKYGIRMLLRSPGFTIVAVLSLAMGIGVNSTVFSLVDSFLLKTLPVENTNQLVYVIEGTMEEPYSSTSYLNYLDYRDQNNVFSGLAAYSSQPIFLTTGPRTERISAEVVSGNYFGVLDVKPVVGRSILPADDQLNDSQFIAVVSYPFWQTHLASDVEAIGKPITLNSQSFTVVGVVPASFKGTMAGMPTDVWVPLTAWAKSLQISQAPTAVAANKGGTPAASSDSEAEAEREEKGGADRINRGHAWLALLGRIKPGITIEKAQAEMTTITKRVQQTYSDTRDEKIVTLVSVTKLHPRAREQTVPIASLTLAGAFIVLLIACMNIASLLLCRATVRRKEIAIRLALGSNRRHLIQQLLTETMLLALLGGLVGLLFSISAADVLMAAIPATYARLVPDFSVDKWVIAFTFLVSLATGIIFGLAPALTASKTNPIHAMKDNEGTSFGGATLKLRNVIVVFQIAVSLVLLVSAGLFWRSLQKGEAAGNNFKSDRILLLSLAPRDFGYNTTIDKEYARQLTERISLVQGIEAATLADNLPFDMAMANMVIFIEGQNVKYNVGNSMIAPHYFETFNIDLLRGRDFTDRDDTSAPRVGIINETMARRFWPGQDPLGKRVRTDFPQNPLIEIVGVVRDSKGNTLSETGPYLYLPVYQKFRSELNLIVRTSSHPTTMIEPIQREIDSLGKRIPVYDFKTLEELASLQLLPLQVAVAIAGFFGLLGLIVATVGIYGITAYSFRQRTREIGIRMALGAQHGDILKLVIKQGLTLSLIGIVIGILGTLAVTRFISVYLYGISSADPLTYIVISLFLTLVALVASYIPARRATRIEPVEALRYE